MTINHSMARSHVSPFIAKLWRLVSEAPSEVGEWSASGDEYVVKRRYEFEEFARGYFTCNWKTFVRQLHFYGFSKTDSRGITWSFSHPGFKEGRPDLLHEVKRKTLGKGKVNSAALSDSKGEDFERLKAEFAAYRESAEAVLQETKKSMMAEVAALKRELSLVKKSARSPPYALQVEQPHLKRRRRESAGEIFTEIEDESEAEEEEDILSDFDYQGLDALLEQFGQDMVAPTRLDPDIEKDMPEVWIVMDKKVNVGPRFFAAFLNSFTAAARAWYQSQAEPVLSRSIPQDYPLLKLQRMLNPSASKILGSTLSADELAHEIVIKMGTTEQDYVIPQDIAVFEYKIDGQTYQVDASDFATCLTNIARGVQMLVNDEVIEPKGEFCTFIGQVAPLFSPFTRKAILLAHKLYIRNVVDKHTAYKLWRCKYQCA